MGAREVRDPNREAGRHQDCFFLDPVAAGLAVRIADFTCAHGTEVEPCSKPAEENFSTGGYGKLGGRPNNSQSYRDQFRAEGNLYAGAHEVHLCADYPDPWPRAAPHFS